MRALALGAFLLGACASPARVRSPDPPVVDPPAVPPGFQSVEGEGWRMAIPRTYEVVRPAGSSAVELTAHDRGSRVLVVRVSHSPPEAEGMSARDEALGLDAPGVLPGPGERILERRFGTAAFGFLLRCSSSTQRQGVCEAIVGSFRLSP